MHAKFDQALLNNMYLAVRAIQQARKQAEMNQSKNAIMDKEGRVLRTVLNQIEERIEVLAQHRADELVAQRDRAEKPGDSS